MIILRQSSAVLRHDLSLCTLEWRFARYMCFLPVVIILGRATYLYAAFGLFAVLAGLAYHVHYIMEVFNLGSWVSLSLLGITAIFVASILERYGQVIRSQLVNWQYRFKSWEY